MAARLLHGQRGRCARGLPRRVVASPDQRPRGGAGVAVQVGVQHRAGRQRGVQALAVGGEREDHRPLPPLDAVQPVAADLDAVLPRVAAAGHDPAVGHRRPRQHVGLADLPADGRRDRVGEGRRQARDALAGCGEQVEEAELGEHPVLPVGSRAHHSGEAADSGWRAPPPARRPAGPPGRPTWRTGRAQGRRGRCACGRRSSGRARATRRGCGRSARHGPPAAPRRRPPAPARRAPPPPGRIPAPSPRAPPRPGPAPSPPVPLPPATHLRRTHRVPAPAHRRAGPGGGTSRRRVAGRWPPARARGPRARAGRPRACRGAPCWGRSSATPPRRGRPRPRTARPRRPGSAPTAPARRRRSPTTARGGRGRGLPPPVPVTVPPPAPARGSTTSSQRTLTTGCDSGARRPASGGALGRRRVAP